MGLSDRPDDGGGTLPPRMPPGAPGHYDYTLQSRIDDLDVLLAHLGIRRRSHGGARLGRHDRLRLGVARSSRVARLVITNTASFPRRGQRRNAWRWGANSRLGGWLIRRFNLFARGAAWMGTTRRLAKPVREAYAGAYDGWEEAIATLRFMQDIPLGEGDRAWPLLQAGCTAAAATPTGRPSSATGPARLRVRPALPGRLPRGTAAGAGARVRTRTTTMLEDRHAGAQCLRSARSWTALPADARRRA